MRTKLTKKEKTQAIAKYARKHNLYPSNVRTVSDHRYAAYREFCEKRFVEILIKE
jgi:hypothetical protein